MVFEIMTLWFTLEWINLLEMKKCQFSGSSLVLQIAYGKI